MAFLTIRSTTFFLLLMLLVSPSYGLNIFRFLTKIFHHGPKKVKAPGDLHVTPLYDRTPANQVFPSLNPEANQFDTPVYLPKNIGLQEALMKQGEKLAGKYFGPNGRKGFRVVRIANKWYIKIANKCNKLQHRLNPNCTQEYSLSPDSVAICIIQNVNGTFDDSDQTTCTTGSSYPLGATCEIDETVNPDCTPK
ncbi:uncharacterized protein [Rutidosis leptorrhynchoides]|uniref:uncharacterized protein n=1 Tax=Rutidosis leptorrhynchoides TaxID=125765 RepID=UPI003A997387